MTHTKPSICIYRVVVTTTILILMAVSPAQAIPIEISGQLADTEGCAGIASADSQSILSDSGWLLGTDPAEPAQAIRSITVFFESYNEVELASNGNEEPDVELKECSAGICNVVVHVYQDHVVSARVHAGLYGFLPFGFQAGFGIGSTTYTKSTSEITCSGHMLVALKAFGGVGPRGFNSAIWKNQASQQIESCTYMNVPSIDESCTIVFSKDFEVEAFTPGVYTSFDVMNGGRISNRPMYEVHLGAIDVVEAPSVWLGEEFQIGPLLTSNAGEWMTTYSAIKIESKTEEALALLAGLAS